MGKRVILLLLAMIAVPIMLMGAYFNNSPYTIVQPNGEKMSCFVSGDEYFNWVHDKEGYTIIMNKEDGYYYYAQKNGDNLAPTSYKAGTVNPATIGVPTWLKISEKLYKEKRQQSKMVPSEKTRSATTGILNNIVIFIKFSDQTEFVSHRSKFDKKFNISDSTALCLQGYYREVSYNQLDVRSYSYPICDSTINLSYTDAHPRAYYCAYSSANPIGYQGDSYSREQELLKNAVNALASQIPDTLNIDNDSDGNVDNVCFIIRGGNNDWAELLWAHRSWLYGQQAYINGKRVMDYTFQPETQNDVNTLCHEMFHALGAPDLYNYNEPSGSNGPADVWDIMCGGFTHMTMYMKYRYGHWIDSIPELEQSGYLLSKTQQPSQKVLLI